MPPTRHIQIRTNFGSVFPKIVHPLLVDFSSDTKQQRQGMAPARPSADGARPRVPAKKIVETIREATGASDEDIKAVLAECNNDVNEATARLIDST